MAVEVKIGQRIAKVELHNRTDNKAVFQIDGKKYEVDIIEVKKGIFSILYKNKSFNIELVNGDSNKKYIATTFRSTYDLEIIDSESRYLRSRKKGISEEAEKIISAPMPGKVVKIYVSPGDKVMSGEKVIIVEAMKMQNEYQVKNDSTIKEILVKEGDTINARQPLIILE